jgi:small subunit ribosomal protein S1
VKNNEELIKKFKKDEKIKVIVLGSNYEKERISLGIKQLENAKFKAELEKIDTGSVVSCVVINVKKDFLEVELDIGLKAIVKRLDLGKNKQDQKTERFEVGDRIEAKVALFNKITGKMLLSIKELESQEQENHFYSEGKSGSTLGSIAGNVFESLKDRSLFSKAYSTGSSIAWSDELEIDSDTIYMELTGRSIVSR